VRNTGTLPISSWIVTFTVPNGLTYVLAANGRIPPGGPAIFASTGLLMPGAAVTTTFAIGWTNGNVEAPEVTCTPT